MIELIKRVVDWLATLLPGEASDPTSLEARVRESADRYQAILARAVDEHETEVDAVQTEARRQVEAQRRIAEMGAERVEALMASDVLLPNGSQEEDYANSVLQGLKQAAFEGGRPVVHRPAE